MLNDDATDEDHPHHETAPGGYLPLNRGFSEYFVDWHDTGEMADDNGLPPLDSELPIYEDFEIASTLAFGNRPGTSTPWDRELRTGSISISATFVPNGGTVPELAHRTWASSGLRAVDPSGRAASRRSISHSQTHRPRAP